MKLNITFLLGFILYTCSLWAADFTTVQDGKWEDPASWGETTASPGLSDNVTINHNILMDDVFIQDPSSPLTYTGDIVVGIDGRLTILLLSATNDLVIAFGAGGLLDLSGEMVCGTYALASSKIVEIRINGGSAMFIEKTGKLYADIYTQNLFGPVTVDGALFTKGTFTVNNGYDIQGLGAVIGSSYAGSNDNAEIFGHSLSNLTPLAGKWIARYVFKGLGDWTSPQNWLGLDAPSPGVTASIAISHPNPNDGCLITTDLAQTGESEGNELFISANCKLYLINNGSNALGRLEIGQYVNVNKELIIGPGGFVYIDEGGLLEIRKDVLQTFNTGLLIDGQEGIEVESDASLTIENDMFVNGSGAQVDVSGIVTIGGNLTIDNGGKFTMGTSGDVTVGAQTP